MSEKRLQGSTNRVAGADLAAWLRARRVEVAAWSPLATLVRDAPPAAAAAPPIGPQQASAIAVVANPARGLSLLLAPPDEGVTVRFYRGAGDGTSWVGHQASVAGDHLFVRSDADQLATLLVATFEQDGPPARLGVDWKLPAAAFQALAGAIDAARARILRSLLQRHRQATMAPFTALEVVEALADSVKGDDRRWWGAVAAAVSPFPLELTATACEAALQQLAELGLVSREPSGWTLSPTLQVASSALSAPLAYCAGRLRHWPAAGAEEERFAAIRTQGVVCWLEFRGADGNARVRCRDLDGEGLGRVLAQRLGRSAAPARGAAAVVAAGAGACPQCGAALAPGAKFCAACGATIAPAAAAPPAAVCPNPRCGAPLPGGAVFCASCGEPVDGGALPS